MSTKKEEGKTTAIAPTSAQTGSAVAIPQVNKSVLVPQSKVNANALTQVTAAQAKFAATLSDIEEWLSMPYVSPTEIAENAWVFTLLRHGQNTFERFNPDGTTSYDDCHMYLAVAQEPIAYMKKTREEVRIEAGERFIISQKVNKLRDKVAEVVCNLLDTTGESIPNLTCRFAKQSAASKAKGWSPAVTFAVVEMTA